MKKDCHFYSETNTLVTVICWLCLNLGEAPMRSPFRPLTTFLGIVCSVCTICTPVSDSAAQAGTQKGQDRLSGEIAIEGTEETVTSPQKTAESGAEKWIQSLVAAVKGGGTVSAVDDPTLTYLNSLYLYCMHKLGACQFVLDAVLEADVINSRAQGKAECPTMSRFWKSWLRDEMEKRSKYLVSVGSAPAVAQFNSELRPKYIKCKDTVAAALEESSSVRYASGSPIQVALARFGELRTQITSKNIDIFSTIGFKFSQKKKEE